MDERGQSPYKLRHQPYSSIQKSQILQLIAESPTKMASRNENIPPAVIRRIMVELRELSSDCPEGVRMIMNEEDMTDIQALIAGPKDTPYEVSVRRKGTRNHDVYQSLILAGYGL